MVFLRTHQPYSGTEVLMETKLERIAEISANSPRPEFTSLYHLINKEMLLQCHKELDGNKAVGVDEITKKEYERNLEQNIDDLVERLKRKSYKPQPSIRVYIPKSNGKLRPLGIACYEDKIVQLALKKILEAIYEPRFLNCMYGFRPNRGCHNAIKELYKRLNNTKICYIVDADIKGFFDHMKHEWIIKFLKLYIKDPNIIGLVKKYLKVGVLDNGELMVNEEGSAQGNIISPILANIYMHNVLTLWYKFIITKECKGDNFLIVYADDFVAGFQYKWEAENYYKLLKERMEKFGLQLEDSKSRLLQSGAYIARAKQKSGECIRLQTFDFLGFTFYCGRSRKGMPYIMPKTSSKKFRQKIRPFYRRQPFALGAIPRKIVVEQPFEPGQNVMIDVRTGDELPLVEAQTVVEQHFDVDGDEPFAVAVDSVFQLLPDLEEAADDHFALSLREVQRLVHFVREE